MIRVVIVNILMFLASSSVYAQGFNQIFDHADTETSYDILNYTDSTFITLGSGIFTTITDSSGLFITEFNLSGELVYQEIINKDSISMSTSTTDALSMIIEDTILVVINKCNIWPSNPDASIPLCPYFLKYDLKNRQELSYQIFLPELVTRVWDMVLHSDGYLYIAGSGYDPPLLGKYNGALLKVSLDGELIWRKTYSWTEYDSWFYIESLNGDLLIGTQNWEDIDSGYTHGSILKMDTSGTFIDSVGVGNELNDSPPKFELFENEIYGLQGRGDENTSWMHLFKMDTALNMLWEKTIEHTIDYELVSTQLEIMNNQMLVLSIMDGLPQYTDYRGWATFSSYSLDDGSLNWERVMKHFDESSDQWLYGIIQSPVDDSYYLNGRVIKYVNPNEQYQWLLHTDNNGCIIADDCPATIWDYFGLDNPYVSVEDLDAFNNHISVYPNPSKGIFNFVIDESSPYEIIISDLNGKIVGKYSESKIDLSEFSDGVYFYFLSESGDTHSGKIIKN